MADLSKREPARGPAVKQGALSGAARADLDPSIAEAARRFAARPRAGRPLWRVAASPASGPSVEPQSSGPVTAPALSPVVFSPELKALFYLWVLLLIFEGALRKWILPGLATPLLLVRDPIAILMYAIAAGRGAFPKEPVMIATQVLGAVTLVGALLADRFIPVVAAYGWRSNFFYFPFIFLLPRFMTRRDVIDLGRLWLLITIPMSFLLVAQFRQSPDAYINMGVGGSEAFTTMYGKVRTSGTFSFINGTVAFLGLAAVFLCYGLFRSGTYPAWLLLSSGIATGVSIAVSGSRSAVFVVSQVIIGVLLAGLYQRRVLAPAVRMAVLLGVIGALVAQFDVVEEGIDVHVARFETAAQQENVVLRLLYEFHIPLWMINSTPSFGYGLGLGTNVGAAYTTGNIGFLLAENDWSRVFLESGLYLGLLFVAMRIVIFLHLAFNAHLRLRNGEVLPVILLASSSLTILTGQLGQPTGLGFMALTAGLVLAALNPGEDSPEAATGDGQTAATSRQRLRRPGSPPSPVADPPARSRWRSGPPRRG